MRVRLRALTRNVYNRDLTAALSQAEFHLRESSPIFKRVLLYCSFKPRTELIISHIRGDSKLVFHYQRQFYHNYMTKMHNYFLLALIWLTSESSTL